MQPGSSVYSLSLDSTLPNLDVAMRNLTRPTGASKSQSMHDPVRVPFTGHNSRLAMNVSGALTLALTGLLWLAPCHAEIYQWKDANGKTVFSERPPLDIDATVVKPKTSPPSAAAIEKLKAQTAAPALKGTGTEKPKTAQKPEPTPEEKKANCEKSKQALVRLESSIRLRYKQENGGLAFLPEDRRQQQIKDSQKNISTWCN